MAVSLTNNYQFIGRSSVIHSKSGSLKYYLLLYAKTVSDLATGIHRVSILGRLASTSGGATFYKYTTDYNGKINGKTAFSGNKAPDANWEYISSAGTTIGGVVYKTYTDIGSGTVSVDCADGLAKDISVSFYWKMISSHSDSYAPAYGASATASFAVTLPAIPRASSLGSISDFVIGEDKTLTIASLSSGFTHTISCIVSGEEKTIAENVAQSYVWDTGRDGDGFLWKKSAAASGTVSGVVRLYTYSGNTKVGYKDTTFNASVPAEYEGEAVAPLLSFKILPDNSGLSTDAIEAFGDEYIALKSKISVDFSGSDYNGAIGFGSYDISVAGKTYYSTDPSAFVVVTTDGVTTSGTVPVTVAIRDKSGRKTEKTEEISVRPYRPPTIKNAECFRTVKVGDVWEHNQTGTSVFVVAARQFEGIGGKNKCSLRYQVLNSGGSTVLSEGYCLTASGNAMTEDEANNDAAFVVPSLVFEMEKAYTIRLTAKDLLGEGVPFFANISISTPTWHALSGGKGFGLGMQAPADGFHNAFDTYFYKSLCFVDEEKNASPLLDFVIETGINGNWTYRKWNSGIAECWCVQSTTVEGWTAATTNVYWSSTKPALTFPITFSSVPTVSGSFANAGAYIFTSLQGVSTVSCSFAFGRTAGGTDAIQGNLHAYVIGRWK